MNTCAARCMRTCALIAALAVTTACSAAINPQGIEAARTAARVKTALVNDPVIGTRVITVRVVGGVARLSGTVRSQEEATRAAEVAGAVSGITAVDLQLQIARDVPEGSAAAPAPPPAVLVADPSRGPEYEFAELEKGPGAFAVGAALGVTAPGARVSINPLIRIGGGGGLKPAVALGWFDAMPTLLADSQLDSGYLRIRPVMAGLRYTWLIRRVAIAPSIVGGYAFNSVRVPAAGDAERLPVAVDNSVVWTPGVSVWIDSGRRTAFNLSIGRVFTSPGVTFVENGQLRTRSLSADTTVVLVGLAYTLF